MSHDQAHTVPTHPDELPGDAVALQLQASQAQLEATLELQSLFARHGGDWEPLLFTAAKPSHVVKINSVLRSVAIVNPTPVSIYVGLGGNNATPVGGFPVPAYSFLQLPITVNLLHVAALTNELEVLAGAGVRAYLIKYRHLVNFAAGPLTQNVPGATVLTSESPVNPVTVAAEDMVLLPANAARQGLSVECVSETAVSLGIGRAGADITLQPSGSWDGQFTRRLWLGAVHAIGPGKLAVVEV
jgi:hypothetical protein